MDDDVPLGGLAKLSSNVAGMVAGLEGQAPSLRRISPSRLSPSRAVDIADVQLSPKRVGVVKGSAGLLKGNSLAAMLERDSEGSVGSAAGLLGSPISRGGSPDVNSRYIMSWQSWANQVNRSVIWPAMRSLQSHALFCSKTYIFPSQTSKMWIRIMYLSHLRVLLTQLQVAV